MWTDGYCFCIHPLLRRGSVKSKIFSENSEARDCPFICGGDISVSASSSEEVQKDHSLDLVCDCRLNYMGKAEDEGETMILCDSC